MPVRHDVSRQGAPFLPRCAPRHLNAHAPLRRAQEMRRACDKLLEAHEDAISDTYQRCALAVAAEAFGLALMSVPRPPAPRSWVQAGGDSAAAWSWNAEARHAWRLLLLRCVADALSLPQLCWNATNGACPEDLARRPLRDFADDGSGAAERVYRHVSYGLQTFVYTCPR